MRWRLSLLLALALLGGQPGSSPARMPRPTASLHGYAGLLELPRAAELGAGRYTFGAWAHYLREEGEQAFRASPVSFGLGLPLHLELSLALTNVSSIDPWARSWTTQVHADLKRQWLFQRRSGLVLSTALRAENLLSAPDLTPLALLDWIVGRTTLVLAGGYRFATTTSESFSTPLVGLGCERPVLDWLTLQAETRWGWSPDATGRLGGSSLGFGGALRFRVTEHIDVVLGATGGLGREADLRLLLGLSLRPTRSGREDSDEDGIPDDRDLCPEEAEDPDEYEDEDGCPDPVHRRQRDERGVHRGPVLLRLKIPVQPIPTWIMDRDAVKPQARPRRPPRSGETRGPRLRLPTWIEGGGR